MADIDLLYQCQWCDNAAVAEGFCGPCGSKADLCRAPKYSRLRVQFANSLHPEFNQLLTTTSTGCCGVWAGTAPISSNPYPLLQWGYHRHYRFKSTSRAVLTRQDGVFGVGNYEPQPVRDLTTFITGARSAIWYYWFQLQKYTVVMHPVRLDYGACVLRVTVQIEGEYRTAFQLPYRDAFSDTRPNTGCHSRTGIDPLGAPSLLSGVQEAAYFVPESCLEEYGTFNSERGPACPGLFVGTNPNTHLMAFRGESMWEPPPSIWQSTPMKQTFCRDFTELPSDAVSLNTFTQGICNTPCGPLGGSNGLLPSFPWLDWQTRKTITNIPDAPCLPPPNQPGACPATLGPTPYPCSIPPGVNPPVVRNRFETGRTVELIEEAIPGSSPMTTVSPMDFGSWNLTFLLT